MKIISIFENDDQALFSCKYEEKDMNEFEWLFDCWNNIQYLEDFFNENEMDLKSDFYNYISVETAVYQTLKDAQNLEDEIRNIVYERKSKFPSLDRLFKNLYDSSIEEKYDKQKCYGIIDRSWLRVYAIKLESGKFLVTGGAIKLTKSMNNRIHTKRELKKLDNCLKYLKENNIHLEN